MTGPDAPYETFEIPEFTLECGTTLRPARIAYQTYGELNADKSNAIVYPTWYSGRHWDLYFPPEDEKWAVSHMRNAELRVIPSVWGHFAGGGPNPVDTAFIDAAVGELLAAPPGI